MTNDSPSQNRPQSAPSTLATWVLLAVIFAAVQFASLFTPPLLDDADASHAQAAQHMALTGDLITLKVNGIRYLEKPPLPYWLDAGLYRIFGENAFAARLPSLIATAATAVLIYTWGVRLGREWIGFAAALSYAFCLQTIQQGRVATADALLIFFMMLTAFAGWLIVRPRPGTGAPVACHAVLALGFAGGFLAKGPEAWLPLLAILWCARGQRLGVVLSFVAGLALILLWGIPAYVETHGDYLWLSWKAGIADRMWGADQGHGASSVGMYVLELPYYVIGFWLSALPWSVLILLNARKLFSGWKLDLADAYLLLNVIPLWIVFTLGATKLPHYTLPTFPLLALLFARRWVAAQLSPSLPIRLAGGFGLAFMALAIVGIPLAVENGYTPSPVGDLVRDAEFALIQIEPVTIPHAGTLPIGMSPFRLTQDAAFALVDFKEPNVVWEMRRVVNGYGQAIPEEDVLSYLNQPGPRAVVISTKLWTKLSGEAEPSWRIYSARGFNAAKGSFIDLTLVVKK